MECRVLLSVLEGGTFRGSSEPERNLLDDYIWRRLPDEVLERVLLMLPTAAKFRFRAVSKEWYRRLSCPKFLELSAVNYPPQSTTSMLCALEFLETGNALNRNDLAFRRSCSFRCSRKVVELDMSFIPPRWQKSEFDVCRDEDGLVCIKSGLACFGDLRIKDEVKLCVVNPVTRIAKELPILRPQEICVEGKTRLSGSWEMSLEVYGEFGGGFKVTLLTGIQKLCPGAKGSVISGTVWGFFVYTSENNSWKLTEGQHVDRQWEDESRLNVLHAVCDGQLYTLSDDDGDFIMHDLETGAFRMLSAESLPESASIMVSLLELKGEIYYVIGGLAIEEDGLFEIWKFNQLALTWEQFAVVPRILQEELFASSMWSMDTVHIELGRVEGVGQSICVRIDICDGYDWTRTLSQHLITCRVTSKEWQIVLLDVDHFFSNLILFEPRLSGFP